MRHRHFGSPMIKNGRLQFISPAKKFYTGRPYVFSTSSPDHDEIIPGSIPSL